jgi:iron complex outermembrane receptor protein
MSLLALGAGLAAGLAVAASTPVAEETETVVVRGRMETGLAVPAAVTRVAPERVAVVDDLAGQVPGLWMVNDQDPGTNILSIRAATTDRLQQASVAFVLDDAPLADTEFFTARLFDVARVEVLRGPQGALFGKNAAGGVIAVQTVAPADGDGLSPGHVEARLGDGGLREGQGALSFAGPGGTAVRLAGLWSAADGWITNRTLAKVVDATETRLLRLSIGGQAGDFSWDGRLFGLEEDGGAAWASSGDVTGRFGGRLAGAALTDPIGDFEGRARRAWGRASFRLGGPLLGGDGKLVVAHDRYEKRWSEELDYRPGPLTFFGFPAFPDGIQPIAQPIEIAATTALARWDRDWSAKWRTQAGLFHQATDKDRVDDFGPLLFGGPALAYDTRSRQSAIFAGVAWEPSAAWLFEAQGRLDRDDRAQTIKNALTAARLDARSARFDRFQPRVAARFQLRPGLVLHASHGEAFRPGGFNPAPAPTAIWTATYRPEITRSTEIGLKAADLPWRGRVEIALYDNAVEDWQNYTFIDGQSVTLNVDSVTIRGGEVSASVRPTAGVTLGLDWSVVEARIVRFVATDPLLGSPATRDYSGKRLPNAPRDTARLWGEARGRLAGFDVETRIDWHQAGVTLFEIDNVLRTPTRRWVDLALTARAGDWTVGLEARNVTDERWAISAFGQGMTGLLAGLGPGGPFDTFTINRGRQMWISLRREFAR